MGEKASKEAESKGRGKLSASLPWRFAQEKYQGGGIEERERREAEKIQTLFFIKLV